ncbi:MAG: transposase [Chthoniobacterales bacterium]
MPSIHLSLHYHLVFGTKDRAPMIAPAWRADLPAFMGSIVRTLEGLPEAVGGVSDHVHLLAQLRARDTRSRPPGSSAFSLVAGYNFVSLRSRALGGC